MNLPIRPLETNLHLLPIKILKELLSRLPMGAFPTLLSEGIQRSGPSTSDTEVGLCGLALFSKGWGDYFLQKG